MTEPTIFPEGSRLPQEMAELAARVRDDGGAALAAYQEPLGKHWQLFALLPIAMVSPTPYQRDLSVAHLKRLVEVMKKIGRFIDPIVAVRAEGGYWTPNGNHRRQAALKLGAKMIAAIVLAKPAAAYQILALNTEKVHNLRDKSLEVVRMYRAMLEKGVKSNERELAFEFERAHFITLGLMYERKPRFSGGAYAPLLSRVDGFLARPLGEAMEERQERAAQLERADQRLSDLVARGRKRGLTHPFLKTYIVARANPLSRARKNLPAYRAALGSFCRNLEQFDLGKIHLGQIAGAAAIAAAVTTSD